MTDHPHYLTALIADMEARGWFEIRICLADNPPNVMLMASRAAPPEWPGPPGYPAAWADESRRVINNPKGCAWALDHLDNTLDRCLAQHATTNPEEAPDV